MSRPAKHDMPVVILCGARAPGCARRRVPAKPMVEIGPQPILWHIMKAYGAHGFDRFVLCLGYKGWEIKQYFLRYKEMHCDFTVAMDGSRPLEVHNQDGFESWRVTCAEPAPRRPPALASGSAAVRRRRHFLLHLRRRRERRGRRRPAGVPLVAGAHRHGHRCPSHLALRRNTNRRPKAVEFDEKPTAEGW